MPLTQAQVRLVATRLNDRFKGGLRCPTCTNVVQWGMGAISQLMEYTPGIGLVAGGPVTPVIPLICQSCGSVQFFSAIALGIVDQQSGRLLEG